VRALAELTALVNAKPSVSAPFGAGRALSAQELRGVKLQAAGAAH
jgi:hypothetical protein